MERWSVMILILTFSTECSRINSIVRDDHRIVHGERIGGTTRHHAPRLDEQFFPRVFCFPALHEVVEVTGRLQRNSGFGPINTGHLRLATINFILAAVRGNDGNIFGNPQSLVATGV